MITLALVLLFLLLCFFIRPVGATVLLMITMTIALAFAVLAYLVLMALAVACVPFEIVRHFWNLMFARSVEA